MGNELKLYFVKDDIWSTDHSMSFERDEEFFSLLKKYLLTRESPSLRHIITHENVYRDAYGEPLQYAYAGSFGRLLQGLDTYEWCERSTWNKAIFAFIQVLAPEIPIVLFWY